MSNSIIKTMTLFRILLLPLLFSTLFAKEPVMVFGPLLKIDPVSGWVVGRARENADSLRRWNLCDANRNITLSAFVGETAALQLLTPPDPALQIQLEDFSGFRFNIYQVGVVKIPGVEKQYLPDILIPLPAGATKGRFSVVSDPELIPAENAYYLFWIDIAPEPSAAGKILTPTLQIYGPEIQEELSIRLTVSDKILPPPSFWLDLNEYGDKYLYPFQNEFSAEDLRDVEAEVFRMGRDHYGVVNPLPYKSQKGEARDGMAPKLLNDDLLHPSLDWSEYDARFSRYFDGSAFDDGKPLRHFYLPFNPNWPAPFELYSEDREKYEQIWAAFAREFIRHFTEKGWTETIFQVYCNQKPDKTNGIPWNLDEPKGVDDYTALRYYADLTHRVFPGIGAVKVRFRVDISHFYCNQHKGNRDKDFRVNGGDAILEPVDIWVISGHSLGGAYAMQKARELVARGKEVWIYSETPRIGEDGNVALKNIRYVWENGLTGFMTWKSVARELNKSDGPDFIFYTVTAGGKKGVYPSIRLKQLRSAIDAMRIAEN